MKPILFNTEMVNAILEGRKTTTRRLIKLDLSLLDYDKNYSDYAYLPDEYGDFHSLLEYSKIKVGDILYVRETWKLSNPLGDYSKGDRTAQYYYKAGHGTECIRTKINKEDDKKLGVWKPSIHMPKEAARIFLRVKHVRAERLYEIDYKGCLSEGVKAGCYGWLGEFKRIWDSTVNKKYLDKYGFDANPWVWVIEFERISRDICFNNN